MDFILRMFFPLFVVACFLWFSVAASFPEREKWRDDCFAAERVRMGRTDVFRRDAAGKEAFQD